MSFYDTNLRRKVFVNPEDFKEYYESNDYRVNRGLLDHITLRHSVNYSNHLDGINELWWTSYQLAPMPGCCGVSIFTGIQIWESYRNKGVGTYFHREAEQFMRDLGYSCGFCTITSYMTVERKILEKQGWKKVHEFVNKRTRNTVEMWVKDI